jgi:ATP-dependent DNA ligase
VPSRSRHWLKAKCPETGAFVITGFQELGDGRLEALFVAEERNGNLAYAGQVRFGLAGKGLRDELDRLRAGPPRKGVVSIEPVLQATSSSLAATGGDFIRDGVLLGLR